MTIITIWRIESYNRLFVAFQSIFEGPGLDNLHNIKLMILYDNYLYQRILSMKEYLKYCTVSELKDQITDTLSSAKQKLSHVSASRRRNDPSLVNKKFYSYVNEIKNKQEEYDLLMNQTN